MGQKRILIVDDMHESIIPLLEAEGFAADYRPTITRSEILEAIGGAVGMIIRSKTMVDSELIAKGTDLKLIARAGAGVDKVDLESLKSKNITLLNAPEGNRDALAEHTTGMILALMHNVLRGDKQIRERIWLREDNRGMELKGKVVGILGYGYMGSAFAERLSAFGCDVIAYDKYKADFGNSTVKEVSLETLKKRAELLTIHVPLTDETRFMIDGKFLSEMPNLLYLINTARGKVVNQSGVLDLLKSGKLKGACLDVLENEKMNKLTVEQEKVFDELSKLDNVIFTPHVAGWTYESYERINKVLVSKIMSMTW